MKTTPRLNRTIGLALGLVICLMSTGCACFRKAGSDQGAAPHVTELNESFDALKEAFNSEPGKPRVLALFSPTCSGCIYGAKALQSEARKVPGIGEEADVLVVWVAMLDSDNEMEARKAARRFNFPGVHHFYDGGRRVGARLMAEQFPTAVRDLLETLPAGHEMREMLEQRKNLPPEKMPLWDALLAFPPGAMWDARSPAPVWWTKQTSYSGEEKPGELTAVFWKKSVHQPPARSDWYLEAREGLQIARNFALKKEAQ